MIFRIPFAGLLAFLVLGLISIANSEESVKESTNSNQKSKLINAQVCILFNQIKSLLFPY